MKLRRHQQELAEICEEILGGCQRGCAAYVITYQALAADTRKINAKEFCRKLYLLVLNEPYHLEDGGMWPFSRSTTGPFCGC